MQQIVPPISIVQKILGQQRMVEAQYRLTAHCLRIEQPEGVLLYHTLTGELLLLSHEEAALLETLPSSVPPALAELVFRRFLVIEGTDEMALVDQTREIARRLHGENYLLTKYLIFTTTACNARCFYCFEAGIPRATMSEETARATGAYIAAHCGGKPVDLTWFGGEPLLNVRAIDTITSELRRHDVEFRSRMDSNASLFDAVLAARAKADWGLYEVQITLDGTEEVYNQRKAYVHSEGSAYQQVLRNIDQLLDASVPVCVRLNLDEDNEQDLHTLVDELAERYAGRPGFSVHCRVLIENKGVRPSTYTEEERCALAEKAWAMWAHLDEKDLALKRPLRPELVMYSCWTDNRNAATITPEGRLGRCESHIDKGIWGSVFSEERDEDVLRLWRERREPKEICQTCALYPRCIRLKKCVIHPVQCSPVERAEARINLTRAIVASYEAWKSSNAPQN